MIYYTNTSVIHKTVLLENCAVSKKKTIFHLEKVVDELRNKDIKKHIEIYSQGHRLSLSQLPRSPVCHLCNIHTYGQFRISNQPCVFGLWGASECPERNNRDTRRIDNLHTERHWPDSNPGPSCCEATVLSTTQR